MNLPEREEKQVFFFKKKLEEAVGIVDKVRSRPHITLLNILLSPRHLDSSKQAVVELADDIRSKTFSFNGFKTFPSNSILFLDIKEQEYLRFISRKIAEKIILVAPGFIPRPRLLEYAHVTIGAMPKMSQEKFEYLRNYFLNTDFQAVFQLQSLVLFDQVKRRTVWTVDLV